MDIELIQQLAVSLGLGLLLGLQRERVDKTIGGIRTFPLIALFGTICALLSQRFGGWVVAAGVLALAAIIILSNLPKLHGNEGLGITTEVAALLLFGLGAYVVVGNMTLAVVVGGAIAVLLQFKESMHRFARAVGENDMKAIMQFVFLSLVILPVLPNQAFGPYGVLNPFEIWLMVVLIVGISLSGYIAYKLLNAGTGSVVAGALGGLISSTATTVSYARRTHDAPKTAPLSVLVIMVAATVSLARVLVEIAAVAAPVFPRLAPPLTAMLIGCAVISVVCLLFTRRDRGQMPVQKNPAQLKSALVFGVLYALVLLAVAAAKDHFGSAGLYSVALLSGLTDMDAITLSTAQLVERQRVDPGTGWRTILLASLSNFTFKFLAIAVVGSRALTVRIAGAFGAAIATGLLIFFLWP
jgi:uncharacterized membrane protein (DUF4010 family)